MPSGRPRKLRRESKNSGKELSEIKIALEEERKGRVETEKLLEGKKAEPERADKLAKRFVVTGTRRRLFRRWLCLVNLGLRLSSPWIYP